jgi:hypothetical protein
MLVVLTAVAFYNQVVLYTVCLTDDGWQLLLAYVLCLCVVVWCCTQGMQLAVGLLAGCWNLLVGGCPAALSSC